jgi:hypothetical protein
MKLHNAMVDAARRFARCRRSPAADIRAASPATLALHAEPPPRAASPAAAIRQLQPLAPPRPPLSIGLLSRWNWERACRRLTSPR